MNEEVTDVEEGEEVTEENIDFVRKQLDEIIDEELFMRVFNENAIIVGQIAATLSKKQLMILLQLAVEYPLADNAKINGREMRAAAAALKEGREAMLAFVIAARENDKKQADKAAENADLEVF